MTNAVSSLQTQVVKTLYGHQMLAFRGDAITKKLHRKGCYDIRTVEFIRQFLRSVNCAQSENATPSAVYVDIGANIGNHALPVASLCRHIYLFEPISAVADVLSANLQNNSIGNFSLFRMALSDHPAQVPIYIRKGNIGASSINKELMILKGDSLEQKELINVDTGDRVIGAQQPDRIDLIKIDVETHEAEVVAGLENTITRHQPVIILEWNHPLTQHRFEQLRLFDTLLARYEAVGITDNHRMEHWSNKRLGRLRRTAYHLFTQRRLQFEKFERSKLYKNIILYPREKRPLISVWDGWPIPDRRFSFKIFEKMPLLSR